MMTVLITASGIRDMKSMTNRVNVTKGSRQARYVTSGKVLAPTNVRLRFPVICASWTLGSWFMALSGNWRGCGLGTFEKARVVAGKKGLIWVASRRFGLDLLGPTRIVLFGTVTNKRNPTV